MADTSAVFGAAQIALNASTPTAITCPVSRGRAVQVWIAGATKQAFTIYPVKADGTANTDQPVDIDSGSAFTLRSGFGIDEGQKVFFAKASSATPTLQVVGFQESP